MSKATHSPEESDTRPTAPKPLRSRNITARVIKQKVWKPPNVENDWCVFVIVGREGSGKSHTCMSILEKSDPSFSAERVYFSPESFLESIKEMHKDERQGKAIMLDEAGVGMGVRSWYDEDQINLNKLMQTARDDNMIVGMTLPRLTELDSQMRGRLHGFCEMRDLRRGEWAEFSWKNVSPTRDERNELYKWYPRMNRGGRKRKVRKLRIGPPSNELATDYEERKESFKEELYEETLEGMQDKDSDDDELSENEIAEELIENGDWKQYKSTHNGNGTRVIDDDMIKLDYDISQRAAGRVKKLLYRSEKVPIE